MEFSPDLSKGPYALDSINDALSLMMLMTGCSDSDNNDDYKLVDGACDLDEDLVITWPDGKQNTIHYHCSDHHETGEVSCTRWYALDGVRQENSRSVIRK